MPWMVGVGAHPADRRVFKMNGAYRVGSFVMSVALVASAMGQPVPPLVVAVPVDARVGATWERVGDRTCVL